MSKFVQLVPFRDHIIGLDSDGRLWRLDFNSRGDLQFTFLSRGID